MKLTTSCELEAEFAASRSNLEDIYSFEGSPLTEQRPCQEHFQREGGRERESGISLFWPVGGRWVNGVGGCGGVGVGALQCDPHGGTEELLLSEHCLADCPHRLPVFFCFTLRCRSRAGDGAQSPDTPPKPHHPPPPSFHATTTLPPPGHTHIHAVQMAILTAQKTAPLCHPLPPGAFAIFFKQPLHSGWVAAVCTVLAGAVLTQTLCKANVSIRFRRFFELCVRGEGAGGKTRILLVFEI